MGMTVFQPKLISKTRSQLDWAARPQLAEPCFLLTAVAHDVISLRKTWLMKTALKPESPLFLPLLLNSLKLLEVSNQN